MSPHMAVHCRGIPQKEMPRSCISGVHHHHGPAILLALFLSTSQYSCDVDIVTILQMRKLRLSKVELTKLTQQASQELSFI